MISGLTKHSTRITGKLSEMSAVLTTSFFFFFFMQTSSLFFGFCSLSSSCLEEDSSTPASVRWRGGRQSGNRWRPREEIVGLYRGTTSSHSSPNLRVISPSVGVKGLRWSISHVLRCLSVWYRAGVRGRRLRISVISEIRLLGGEVD